MSNYSKADNRTQWFQDNFPGAGLDLTPNEMKVVLHTTEGMNWPGYDGGRSAPNYTHQPAVGLKRSGWRAHFPDEKSSRALRNTAGGVETNTDDALQVELIGTCDPKHRVSWDGAGRWKAGVHYVYWPNATDAQLKEVAAFLADQHKRHGLKLLAPRTFAAYPNSIRSQRMGFTEWRNTAGVVGHQHVPENSHGDPGNINARRILEFARAMVTVALPPTSTILHSMHASMQYDDSTSQKQADVTKIFARAKSRRVHWITGTEVYGGETGELDNMLERAAEANGYRFEHPAGTDCWVAVRKDIIAGRWGVHYEKIIDGKGVHRDLGVLCVGFDVARLGHITVSAVHMLPARVTGSASKNAQLLAAVGRHAESSGAGTNLFFVNADMNSDDRVLDTFGSIPITTSQDELKQWEATAPDGKTIDVIASYDLDARVKANYVRSLDDKEFFLNTDHYLLEAGFTVRYL